MKRAQYTLMLAVLGLWSVTVLPLYSHAQALKKDCREGSGCTAADLAIMLFPEGGREPGSELRTRGLGDPSKPTAVAPEAVALKVEFDTNSDAIRPQYYSNLNELGTVLAQPKYAAYRIQIEGHTDSVGSDQYNKMLSQKRAESVKHYLLQHFPNIKPENLTAVGYGKDRLLINPDDTLKKREKNRRVQVVNLGQ